MQRIIIFDGADMCGKTNIAHELSVRIKIPYFKNVTEKSAFVSNPDYFLLASCYIDTYTPELLAALNASVIFDRNYPSEFVYPRIFQRAQDLVTLKKIDKRHAELGTTIIIPYRTSFANIVDDVHTNITSEFLTKIDKLYEEFCDWSDCRTLRLCVDDMNLEREINEIIDFIK